MFDDPITESGPVAPPSRIDLPLRQPVLHEQFNAARGVMWGLFFGAEFWLALAVIVCVLV